MKPLRIISNKIIVSTHTTLGLFIDHRVEAIFPGCRKTQRCIVSAMAGSVWVKPLYGYNGTANVQPKRWECVVDSAVVVSDQLFPVEITPLIADKARQDAKSICNCPAVNAECHPDYNPEYTDVSMEG